MKIRTRLLIGIIVCVLVALGAGVALFTAYRQMNSTLAYQHTSRDIMRAAFELKVVADDYLLHHTERAQTQWQLSHESLSETLKGVESNDQEVQAILDEIQIAKNDSESVFDALVAKHEQSGELGEGDNPLSEQVYARLQGQLSVKLQSMVSAAFQLAGLTDRQMASSQQTISFLLAALIVSLVAVVLGTSYWTYQSIVPPIRRLQRGTEIVGAGNLDYKLSTAARDEIGDLSQAFDEMTGKLKETTVSRDELEIRVEERTVELAKANEQLQRDIIERKQAEEALRESEQKFRNLAEQSPNMIYINKKGRVVYANKKCEDIMGYKRDEFYSPDFDFLTLIAPEYMDLVKASFGKHTKGEEITPYECTLITKENKRIETILTTALMGYEGETAILGIVTDITERKRMEEQLIVTDRLASVGELAAGIAHELNNPLTSIIGFSQLLMDRDVPDDVKEDLKIISSEAQRTAAIVKNLLTFGRKHAPVKQSVNINSVIENVLQLRAYEQRVNNIEVITQFASNLPEVMADHFQLQQVFVNIVINAEHLMIEANRRGTLTITTEKVDNMVRASFADDGPGINKEDLGHVFDPFFTTKEVGKGTGLGLSICHGIIAEHGGRIYAESELGKGATFVVELPIEGQ